MAGALRSAALVALGIVGVTAGSIVMSDCERIASAPPGEASPADGEPPATPRFGVNAVHADRVPLRQLGASWYLNWTYIPVPETTLEFVPMICAYPDEVPSGPRAIEWLRDQIAQHQDWYPDGTLWVIGNEVGYRVQLDSRSPDQYARDFEACRSMLLQVNSTYRVAMGPIILSDHPSIVRDYTDASDGFRYLEQVLDAYEAKYGAPMAASHFSATAYVIGEDPTSLDVFRRQILRLRRLLAERGLRDRRLMITEFGVAHGRVDEQRVRDFLDATTRFLNSATDPDIGCSNDSDRLVQRWAWFTAHPLGPLEKLQRLGLGSFRVRLGQTSLFDRNGELNALGLAYRRAVWRARGATPKEALHESPTTRNTRAGKG